VTAVSVGRLGMASLWSVNGLTGLASGRLRPCMCPATVMACGQRRPNVHIDGCPFSSPFLLSPFAYRWVSPWVFLFAFLSPLNERFRRMVAEPVRETAIGTSQCNVPVLRILASSNGQSFVANRLARSWTLSTEKGNRMVKSRTTIRISSSCVLALSALVIGLFVWPTPYSHGTEPMKFSGTIETRTHRFTGQREYLVDGEWMKEGPSQSARNEPQ